MIETKKMAREIRAITLILMLVFAMVSLFLFPDAVKSITMGIVVGALTGIIGFNMIVNLASHIDGTQDGIQAKAFRSYTRRYLLYALIFVLSVSVGMHILALLTGMLAHKASIFIYTYIHRKEDE